MCACLLVAVGSLSPSPWVSFHLPLSVQLSRSSYVSHLPSSISASLLPLIPSLYLSLRLISLCLCFSEPFYPCLFLLPSPSFSPSLSLPDHLSVTVFISSYLPGSLSAPVLIPSLWVCFPSVLSHCPPPSYLVYLFSLPLYLLCPHYPPPLSLSVSPFASVSLPLPLYLSLCHPNLSHVYL